MFLGFWLVWGTEPPGTPGAHRYKFQLGPLKGDVEYAAAQGDRPYRVILRDGRPGEWVSGAELDRVVPGATLELAHSSTNPVFRLLNVTSWGSLAWVALGLAGQMAFFGRMAVQWVVSERRRESVVPPIFWYLSLAGGVMLFAYFVWRQDPVGVLGQTSGVVIYGRNIRLLYKQRRREARKAAKAASGATGSVPTPDPAP
jgi:lipid-A-disaccharide synthase-like uncharacterized protein